MKRIILVLMLALICCFSVATPALACGDGHNCIVTNPDDGWLPNSPISGMTPLHQQYSVTNYLPDGEYSKFNPIAWLFEGLASTFMLLFLLLLKLVLWMVEEAFTLQIHDKIMVAVGDFAPKLGDAIWGPGIRSLLWFVGAIWFGWEVVVKRNFSRALVGLGSMILVSVIALTAAGGGLVWFASGANTVFRDVAAPILAAGVPVKVLPGMDPLTVAASHYSDQLWVELANKSWCVMEFRTIDNCRRYTTEGSPLLGDQVLSLSSSDRDGWFKKQPSADKKKYLAMWTETWSGALIRCIFALLLLLVGAVFLGWLAFVALNVVIASAFGSLWWCSIALVFLLAAFFPSWAGPVLRWLFAKLIGPYIKLVAYATVMTVGLVGLSTVWMIFDGAWLLQLIGLGVWAGILIFNGHVVVAFISNLPLGIQSALGAAESAAQHRGLMRVGEAVLGAAVFGRVARGLKGMGERKQAARTLNQRLASHRAEYAKTGKKSALLEQAESRMQLGAKRLWTKDEVNAEVEKNRELKQMGIRPGTIEVDRGSTMAEKSDHIANVQAEIRQHRSQLQMEHRQHRRTGLIQNTQVGRFAHWAYQKVWSKHLPAVPANSSPIKPKPKRKTNPKKVVGRSQQQPASAPLLAAAGGAPLGANQSHPQAVAQGPAVATAPAPVTLVNQHGAPLAVIQPQPAPVLGTSSTGSSPTTKTRRRRSAQGSTAAPATSPRRSASTGPKSQGARLAAPAGQPSVNQVPASPEEAQALEVHEQKVQGRRRAEAEFEAIERRQQSRPINIDALAERLTHRLRPVIEATVATNKQRRIPVRETKRTEIVREVRGPSVYQDWMTEGPRHIRQVRPTIRRRPPAAPPDGGNQP